MSILVLRDKPGAMTLINKALNSIFSKPTTPFLTATVNEIFFDGVTINCTVTDFAGKAVCTQLKTEGSDLVEVAPNIFKFSLMGPVSKNVSVQINSLCVYFYVLQKNGTATNKFTVKRGIKNYKEVGQVVKYNDQTELDVWSTDKCNQFRGTDGTIFPGLIPNKADIPSFAAALCR